LLTENANTAPCQNNALPKRDKSIPEPTRHTAYNHKLLNLCNDYLYGVHFAAEAFWFAEQKFWQVPKN